MMVARTDGLSLFLARVRKEELVAEFGAASGGIVRNFVLGRAVKLIANAIAALKRSPKQTNLSPKPGVFLGQILMRT